MEIGMTVKDDLIAARALIQTPETWGKGYGKERNGNHCAATATGHNRDTSAEQMRLLADALPVGFRGRDGWSCFSIFRYNDDPATTHADIMALFDRAINAA